MPPAPQIIKPAVFRHVENETPSGNIDGINTLFTIEHASIEGSLQIYLNGLRLRPGVGFDYTMPNNQSFIMEYAPLPGDELWVDYFRK